MTCKKTHLFDTQNLNMDADVVSMLRISLLYFLQRLLFVPQTVADVTVAAVSSAADIQCENTMQSPK